MSDRTDFLDRNPKLQKALAEEERAFRIANEYAEKTDYVTGDGNLVRAQDWFRSLEVVVREYRRLEQEHTGAISDALGRIQGLCRHLGVGKIPTPVRFVAEADGNSWWPGEQDDIAAAVYYIQAVRAGHIEDRSFNATIRNAYGVSKTTVARWEKDASRICNGRKPAPMSQRLAQVTTRGARYQQWRTGRRKPADDQR